jgi:hypothetical protein
LLVNASIRQVAQGAMHSRMALPLEDMKSQTLSQPDPAEALKDY